MKTDRTRVLILIKGLGLGGAERLIVDGSRVWDRASFEYGVAYVLPWKDQLVPPLEEGGTEVRCIGGERGLDIATPFRFRRLVSEFRPDLVHAHLPSAGVLARVSTSVPVVYTEHNIADSYRRPMRILNRATYGRNRRVIAVSGPVADSLRGYPGPEPMVIPNGIPVESEDPSGVRGEFGLEPSQRLIVHVGNIRPHKGHSNLVEATAILARRMPEVMVLSAGAEKAPGDLARVNREAEDLGVSPHIRFLGRREDGRRLLAAADVVVNPSDVEGLPVTILEALSYARPVVATDVGGVSKVIEHERTGLLVPANDPEGLASALERALTDPTATSWGDQGRALVSAHHSIEAMVRSYEDVYRTVVDV